MSSIIIIVYTDSIGFSLATMSSSQLALIKNLCLCYCDNKPGRIERIFKNELISLNFDAIEILEKTVNTVSHLLTFVSSKEFIED